MVPFDIDVSVPAFLILRSPAVELHEANPAFDHSSGVEALTTEVRATLVIEAVHVVRRWGFAIEIEYLGCRRLHSIGEFKAANARFQFNVGRSGFLMFSVKCIEEVELSPLLPIRDVRDAI